MRNLESKDNAYAPDAWQEMRYGSHYEPVCRL